MLVILIFLVLSVFSANYIVGLHIGKFQFTTSNSSIIVGSLIIITLICLLRKRVSSITLSGTQLQLDLNEIKFDINIFKETIYPILLFELGKVEHDGLTEGNFCPRELDEFISSSNKLYQNFYADDIELKRYLICAKAKLLETLFRILKQSLVVTNWQKSESDQGTDNITEPNYPLVTLPYNMTEKIRIEEILNPAFDKNLRCGLTRNDLLFDYDEMKVDISNLKHDLTKTKIKFDDDYTLSLMDHIENYFIENKAMFASFPKITN
ncbi:hypothetical protein [Leuconostoc gasicomitatum]|uniref:hypothetical protein n=1 Tax=Leuconostoc gasicomitatum TaxID=115778 RepID=UPI0007E1C47A|nr:hypothetical protein [Leuconostoc gasicomitatum]CUW10909.1 hypothetical protein PB1E_1747 [Leuconostoc gasicomitatum]